MSKIKKNEIQNSAKLYIRKLVTQRKINLSLLHKKHNMKKHNMEK